MKQGNFFEPRQGLAVSACGSSMLFKAVARKEMQRHGLELVESVGSAQAKD
jgi:hypothetical protein